MLLIFCPIGHHVPNIFGESLTIAINTAGLGGNSDNIALDNIQFSQVSAVPVPAAFWLFGSGLIGLIGRTKIVRSSSFRRE